MLAAHGNPLLDAETQKSNTVNLQSLFTTTPPCPATMVAVLKWRGEEIGERTRSAGERQAEAI
jgi:hypothetical protein